LGAGVATADEAGVGFEVALDVSTSGIQRFLDLASVTVGAERPDERDGLRRRQGEVEAGDRGLVGSQLVAAGVKPVEGGSKAVAVSDAGEPVSAGEAADPTARRGTVLGEVLLPAVDDLSFVVVEVSTSGDREQRGASWHQGASVWTLLICPEDGSAGCSRGGEEGQSWGGQAAGGRSVRSMNCSRAARGTRF
jgi:hypothetical protein